MTGLEHVVYAANHGMTLWIDGEEETPEAVSRFIALAAEVAEDLAGMGAEGVTVEHTGPNVAVHYRQAPDEQVARARILEAIKASEGAPSFRVHEGRKVFELRPPVEIDKGTALERLARRFGSHALLCLGDDRTDVDMFAAVTRLRDEGVQGVSIAVSSEEAPERLRDMADYVIEGTPGVEWLLGELVRFLSGKSP
jgi:trehalose 6-phosphate phosphatase